MIASVIVRKVHTNVCLTPNVYQLNVIKILLKTRKIFRVDDRSLLARNALRSREQVNKNTVTKQNQLTDDCIITR
jgi:ABC-type enterochelin transport system permease subunit